jgi:hypothetical protein
METRNVLKRKEPLLRQVNNLRRVQQVFQAPLSKKNDPVEKLPLQPINTKGPNRISNLAGLNRPQTSSMSKNILSGIVPPLDRINSQSDIETVLKMVYDKHVNVLPPDRVFWDSIIEKIPQGIFDSPIITMFGRPIYKQGRTAVYNIYNHNDYVIKYYTYCYNSMDPFDPVVTEATFMKFLEPLNICPKVLHISGTTTVGNDMGKVQQTTCDKDDGSGQYDGPIRYMIMEKVGIDLYDLMIGSPNNRIPFREAIQYGIKMMELIQKLHSKNIIHGDAHLGFSNSPWKSKGINVD